MRKFMRCGEHQHAITSVHNVNEIVQRNHYREAVIEENCIYYVLLKAEVNSLVIIQKRYS